MAFAEISSVAEAALETFAKEPFVFALKPVVKRVLESIVSSKSSFAQVSLMCFPATHASSFASGAAKSQFAMDLQWQMQRYCLHVTLCAD